MLFGLVYGLLCEEDRPAQRITLRVALFARPSLRESRECRGAPVWCY